MQRDDYRATGIVMFGLAAATLTGFLRQAAIAHQLGAGRATDVYLVAFAVPEFVFIALPIILAPAFIPLFADCRLRMGEARAWRFGLRVAGVLLATLLLFTACAGLGAPLYVRWLAPGFGPSERAQAVLATRRMLPAISLMGVTTLTGVVLQVYRRFARPVLAAAVYNLTFIAALLALPLARPLDRAAWGVTLGAVAALMFQLPLLWSQHPRRPGSTQQRRLGPHEATQPLPRSPRVSQAARLAGPLAAGYAIHHVILFVDRAMATTLGAGSAAALNFSYHLALAVGQMSGLAVSTALFPHLAEQIAKGNTAGARASLSNALRFVWTVGLPAACGLILLRTPVVRVLFERGAFGQAATATVSAPLVWYALAVLADALCQPLWRVVYAAGLHQSGRSAWTVLAVNGLQTGVRLLGNLILLPLFGTNGLALSAALGLSVQAVVLGWLVRRWLGTYLTHAWWRDATRVLLATAATAGAISLWIAQPFGKLRPPLYAAPALATLLVGGTLGSLTYLLVLRVLQERHET